MSQRFEFGPLERRGLFLGLRLGQLVVGLIATAAIVGVFSLTPSPAGAAGALAVLVVAAGAVMLPIRGRSAEQWAPVAAGHLVVRITGHAAWIGPANLRGHRLVVPAPGAACEVLDPVGRTNPEPRGMRRRRDDVGGEDTDDGSRPLRWVSEVRRVDAGDPQPPYLKDLHLLAARWRKGDVGVIKEARRSTYVGVIAAHGRGSVLLDQGEKERLVAGWGSLLAGVARESAVITRLQWLERTVPDDSETVVRHLQDHRMLPASSPFVTSYLALLDEAGPATQQHEVFIALQVGAARASAAIRQLRCGVDVGACEVLSRELDAFAGGLRRAGVDVRGILSPRMLAAVLRHAVDPPSREHLAHRTAANPDVAGASPRNALPRRSSATWSTFRSEGAHHATYWVSEWPRSEVGTDWMAPLLLGTRCRRTVSVVMQPAPPALALRRVEAARLDDETTQSFRERFGFRRSVRKRREAENVARAEEELNAGHSYFAVSAYITMSASSRRELDAACADMEQQARQSRLDVRREYGSQDVAFTYTLPLCRGLR